MKRNRSTFASAMIIAFMSWQFGQAGWIAAKAELAQWLIADAWQQSLASTDADQSIQKPWQWADTWPVARLQAPAHNADFYVLEGDSGNALAFGPGRNRSSRFLGEGTSVIGGHRDTHFRFLKDSKLGEPLRVQSLSGEWLDYTISDREVIDIRDQSLQANLDEQQLILVTCYPFDTLISGGPLRLVVTAKLIEKRDVNLAVDHVQNHEHDAEFSLEPNRFDMGSRPHQFASQYTESSPAMAF